MQEGISSFATLHQIAPPGLKQAWETETVSFGAPARWRDKWNLWKVTLLLAGMLTDISRVSLVFCIICTAIIRGEVEKVLFAMYKPEQVCNGHHVHIQWRLKIIFSRKPSFPWQSNTSPFPSQRHSWVTRMLDSFRVHSLTQNYIQKQFPCALFTTTGCNSPVTDLRSPENKYSLSAFISGGNSPNGG